MFSKTYKSPNFDDRDGISPSMIIIHYTGMETGEAALKRLCDPQAKVSAHYVIDKKGEQYQLVGDKNRAWHAGVSSWNGIADINAHSIGIELVNPGHEFGYVPFPEQQISVLIKLCQLLMDDYDIHPKNVLGHSDVAPARKQDPGELFPWATLSLNNVGLWPAPEDMDVQAAEDIVGEQSSVEELLSAYGYDMAEDFTDVVIAFHRHFCPEKFDSNQDPEVLDIASIAKLLSLLRLSHET